MAEEPGPGGGVLRVLFWGTPSAALPALRALGEAGHQVVGVVTQPDRPAGRGRALCPSPVKSAALEKGCSVLTPERPRGEEFMAALRELEPHLSVVVAYGHILRQEVLELPPLGSLNLHFSLLPELRGAAPVHWALLRGYRETGVTVMRMVEALDAGPILLQLPVAVGAEETASELGGRLAELGAVTLLEVLRRLEEGGVEEREQDHARATLAPKVDREMARVDWRRPAPELCDHIRGLDEVPGSWSLLEGEAVKLFRPLAGREGGGGAVPGTVLEADPAGGLRVATGKGALRIREIQPPGKRRMEVAAWLRGHPLPPGARFL